MNVEVFDKIEQARTRKPTPEARRQLMLSFAFATTRMENDYITLDLLERVAKSLPNDAR